MNLFAIVEINNEIEVYRIPLSAEIQGSLNNLFTQQSLSFLEDKEEITFDGSYNAGNDEIFRIDNFPLSQDFINSANNPINYNILNIDVLEGKIKAIYSTIVFNNILQINFQYFDSRKILANRGISLFLNGETYRQFDNKGIVISGGLTAIFKNENLYFSSYFNTRKFLNLEDFYQEATEQNIDEFLAANLFNFEDEIGFKDDLNSLLRKKIKAIQNRQVLENNTAHEIRNQAQEFGIDLEIENNQLSIPRDRALIKNLIRFLDEDYFITPLTNRKCITNSKREVN